MSNTHASIVARPPLIRRLTLLVGVSFFALYWFTLSPGAFPGESASLLATAIGAESNLTPDHPFWRALVAGWLHLPLGALPYRLNLLSAVCGASALALLCHSTARWIHNLIRGDLAEDLRSVYAPAAAGFVAALTLGFSAPMWSVATHCHYLTFDLLLVLIALELLLDCEIKKDRRRFYALAFFCGAGAAETYFFIALLPYIGIRILQALRQRQQVAWHGNVRPAMRNEHGNPVVQPHWLPWRDLFGMTVTGLLGMGMYGLTAWLFRGTEGFWLRGYTSGTSVVTQMWRAQVGQLAALLPRHGWVYPLVIVFAPWAAVAAGARNVLRKPPNPAGNVLHVLLLLPVMLLLFHAAVLPWQPVVLIGRIPLLEFLLIAMIAGYTTAYWLPRSLPILRTKEKKPPADHKHTEKKRSDNLEAAQGTLIILAVLILLAIAAVGNGAHADGRRGAFADAYASVILDQMGSRQWLATDGRIDHHLRILAAVRNQPLHLVNLSDEHHPIQIRQLLRMIDAEPEMQPLRYRLRNAATLGAMAFIQEWLVSDSQADASLLLYEMPELWNETGRQAQPDRLLFAGTHSLDALRIVPLLKAQRLVWDDMDAIVFTASNSMDTLDAFRQELRQHLSLMANTLGLLLEDLGRPEEAYEAYDRALVFAPANVSAILNRLALIRQGMHTEDQNEAEQTAAAALATLKSAVPINRISRVYGCVRESAAFAAQATDWARQHQTGLAILCMQRAIELAPAAEKSAYRHRLAALLLEQGNIVQSEAMYRAFLLTDAADRNAVLSLLRIAIGRQDATEAHRWLDQARHAGVPESTLAAEDAAVDIVAGDLEKARRKLLALTDQHSENVQTWATLASVLIKQGEIGEVERFVLPQMQRASRKGATHPLYYLTFGLVQKAKGAGCHAAARQAFRQALALCPDWRYLQEDILRLDLALCDNDAAEQDAGKLLLWNRNHSSANYVMGVLRLKQGRIEESEDYLRRSVATQGTAQAWNTLAEVLRLRRTLPEAEQAARQSLARDAKNAATWDTLACVLLDANRQREAREAIETARRLDLDNPRVQLTAARILARSGQWVAARDALRQVSAKSKELPVKVREDLTALATEIGRQ